MKKVRVIIFIIILSIVILIINNKQEKLIMIDFSKLTKNEIKEKGKELNLNIGFKYETNNILENNSFISQSIKEGVEYKKGTKVVITLSKKEEKKELTKEDYIKYEVNEMGLVPIMMYHGIHNIENKYTGGNVDKDGYNRTSKAFINDLEMYYKSGYRMIRLIDYIDGNINVELGKSPIILTFDDGNINNIKVLGLDDNNNPIIDENSAVGILESFKKKYPDYNITATFFLNEGLFGQPKYNDIIIKWLVNNGYDVGNHTLGHVDFTKIGIDKTQTSVGYIYQKLNQIIPNKYVPIVALPYGSPYNTSHPNFEYIIKGKYNDYGYETKGTLRVGWEPNTSPFSNSFNPLFMKRVRAYDNNGKDFDIEYVFKLLEKKRYISDGDKDTIVVTDDSGIKEEINKKITKY